MKRPTFKINISKCGDDWYWEIKTGRHVVARCCNNYKSKRNAVRAVDKLLLVITGGNYNVAVIDT